MYPNRRKDPLVAARARITKQLAFGKAGFIKQEMHFTEREKAALDKLVPKELGQLYQSASRHAWIVDQDLSKNIIEEAANQGCSLAKLLLTVPDWKGNARADAAKLVIIADQMPLAYYLLGNLYYEPDEKGETNKQLAVEYYMKAEERAVLGRRGALRILDYYRNGGKVRLTEDDVKRLELIVQQKSVETE